MSVALDTMILIWGIVNPKSKRGNPRQADVRELQRKSLVLIDVLTENKETVIAPAVTVGELLVGVDPKSHDEFLAEIQQRFFCPPYDLKACDSAASPWLKHRTLPKAKQIERHVLKSDVMIIATAAVAGATTFYSHDARTRGLAEQAGLQALDLPDRHPDMHMDAEIKRQVDSQNE